MGKHNIVIDTETAGDIRDRASLRVYDMGWTVSTGKGDIVARRSFIVRETWENSGLMDTCYYRDKLPVYRTGIATGEWEIKPLNTVRQYLLLDMVEFKCSEVYAYNSSFDRDALNASIEAYSKGYVCSFLPDNVPYLDIMAYAQDRICMSEKYIRWAIDNNQLSEKGNIKCSAEALYRYISGNHGFVEAHTAADDAAIESAILHYARTHGGRRKGSFTGNNRWRKIANLRKELGL